MIEHVLELEYLVLDRHWVVKLKMFDTSSHNRLLEIIFGLFALEEHPSLSRNDQRGTILFLGFRCLFTFTARRLYTYALDWLLLCDSIDAHAHLIADVQLWVCTSDRARAQSIIFVVLV